MPHFTKLLISEIASRLNVQGMKDSLFTKIKSLDSPISIAALLDGKNVLIPSDKFKDYATKSVDIYKIPVEFEKYDANTLGDIIEAMLSQIGIPQNPIIANASNVGYRPPTDVPSMRIISVEDALNIIFRILHGVNPFPTAASESDIINIFTTTI